MSLDLLNSCKYYQIYNTDIHDFVLLTMRSVVT